MEIMQNIETELEEKTFFFKSSWRGKVGLHVFEQEGIVDIITDRKVAKTIRQNNLFKNKIVVELTEEQVAEAKLEEAKRLNATVVVEMNKDEFEAKVLEEVERRLAELEAKRSDDEVLPAKEAEAQKLAEDVAMAKVYLDEHGIKYHPATGIVKLEAAVAEHQASLNDEPEFPDAPETI